MLKPSTGLRGTGLLPQSKSPRVSGAISTPADTVAERTRPHQIELILSFPFPSLPHTGPLLLHLPPSTQSIVIGDNTLILIYRFLILPEIPPAFPLNNTLQAMLGRTNR